MSINCGLDSLPSSDFIRSLFPSSNTYDFPRYYPSLSSINYLTKQKGTDRSTTLPLGQNHMKGRGFTVMSSIFNRDYSRKQQFNYQGQIFSRINAYSRQETNLSHASFPALLRGMDYSFVFRRYGCSLYGPIKESSELSNLDFGFLRFSHTSLRL